MDSFLIKVLDVCAGEPHCFYDVALQDYSKPQIALIYRLH